MNTTQAWTILFADKAPAGAKFDEAVALCKGKNGIPDNDTLDDATRNRAEDFLTEQAPFIAANAGDPRAVQWKQLAAALSGAPSPAPVVVTLPAKGAAAAKVAPPAKDTAPTVQPAVPAPPVVAVPPRLTANAISGAARSTAPVGGPTIVGFADAPEEEDRGGRSNRQNRGGKNYRDDEGDRRREAEEKQRQTEAAQAATLARSRLPPPDLIQILLDPMYVMMRDGYLAVYGNLRSNDSVARANAQDELENLGALVCLWRDGSLGPARAAVARHLLRLNNELQKGCDVSEKARFNCEYISGRWEE